MKKLLMAMSAVAMAFGLNAATVDWKYKIIDAQGTEGYNSGYTVYLVNAAAWNAANISASTFSDSSIVLDSTTFADATGRFEGSKIYNTIKTGTTVGSRSVEVASLEVGSSLNVYYVILDTNVDPNKYTAISDVIVGRDSVSEESLGSNISMTASAASSATWTAVPEPTSGLLMLLGMAGLALKRKRA